MSENAKKCWEYLRSELQMVKKNQFQLLYVKLVYGLGKKKKKTHLFPVL